MLTWNVAWLVNLAGIVGGAAKVGAVALMIAVLTLGERLAIFDVVVISAAPCAVEGIVVGMVGPEVIEVVAGVVDLVVGHVGKGGRAVNDPEGDVAVGIGICKCLDASKHCFVTSSKSALRATM